MSTYWTDDDSDNLDRSIRDLRKQERRERSPRAQPAIIPTADQQKILGYPLRDSHIFDSMHLKPGRPKKGKGVIDQILNTPDEEGQQ